MIQTMISPTLQILVPATISFLIGMAITPIVTHYLYQYKTWKKAAGKKSLDGTTAEQFNRLHQEHEVRAPRMGGIVIWVSTLLTTVGIAALAWILPIPTFEQLNFLSRSETWVPLAALIVGAIWGFIDDMLIIRPGGEGLPLRFRLFLVFGLSIVIGLWFWLKLDVTTVAIPFGVPLEIGWLIVPLFVLVSLSLYASGVIDGIDGLSGGVFASIFSAYAIIAFMQNQIDLAAFCGAVVGGLLAFLWFNIPPARFYMSDTGTMALTLALGVIVFMTDTLGEGMGIAPLPIIGALLVATVASNLMQMFWKKVFGKKLFLIAPLHHHFEAMGWPGYKVTMRYWVLSIMFAFMGVIFALSAQ
ncbi:hypothetical protein C4568_01320 [Candidatus Parcubacteria bacterium]|nr:MAG: hypothetical protein C4568_01320 [Candidatus Parcubacteria bacterium]